MGWNATFRRGSVACRKDLRPCRTESRMRVRGLLESRRNARGVLSAHRLPAERLRPHAPALERPARWRIEVLHRRIHARDGAEVFELRHCIVLRDPSPSGDDLCRNGHYFQLDCFSPANVDDRVKFSPRSTAPLIGLRRSLAKGWRLLSWEYAIKVMVLGFDDYLVGRRQSQRVAVGMNSGR